PSINCRQPGPILNRYRQPTVAASSINTADENGDAQALVADHVVAVGDRLHRHVPDVLLIARQTVPGGEPGHVVPAGAIWLHREGAVVVIRRDAPLTIPVLVQTWISLSIIAPSLPNVLVLELEPLEHRVRSAAGLHHAADLIRADPLLPDHNRENHADPQQ